jgi:hypothetical protein
MIFMILHVDLALTPTFLEAICRAAPDSAPSGCAGAAMSMMANMTYINTAQTFHVGLVARNLHTPMFESELRKQSVVINSGRACDESSVVLEHLCDWFYQQFSGPLMDPWTSISWKIFNKKTPYPSILIRTHT